MPNIPRSGYVTAKTGRTEVGRDQLKLPGIPSTTLLTIEISGTAEVVIEYSEDEVLFIPVSTVNETSGIQFAIPASVLAVNVTSISSGYVRVIYRTVILDNIPSQTLIVYGNGIVTSPVINSVDHGALSGLGDDDHTQYVLRNILTNDGDMFVRDGGQIVRLPKGTNGQVLTIVANFPTWV